MSAKQNPAIVEDCQELETIIKKNYSEKVLLMNGTARRVDFIKVKDNYLLSHFRNFGWLQCCPFDKERGLQPIVNGMPFLILKNDSRLEMLLKNAVKRDFKKEMRCEILAVSPTFKALRFISDSEVQ